MLKGLFCLPLNQKHPWLIYRNWIQFYQRWTIIIKGLGRKLGQATWKLVTFPGILGNDKEPRQFISQAFEHDVLFCMFGIEPTIAGC